jgi:hypothetical protein
MLYGAGEQNKSLSEAGKTPKDTSHRLDNAKKYSATVSSSKESTKNVSSESNVKIQSSKQNVARGSWEGLDRGKSTHIQMNNSGYAAKSLQKARYEKGFASHKELENKNIQLDKPRNQGIINNYTNNSSPGSSSEIINDFSRNNMLFK